MWKIERWTSPRRKKYFFGVHTVYRVCTWPIDDFNGTLRKIKHDDKWLLSRPKSLLDQLLYTAQ